MTNNINRNIILALLFFFVFFLHGAAVEAANVCALDEVYESCGIIGEEGYFACTTPTPLVGAPWSKVLTHSFATNNLNGFDIPVSVRDFSASNDPDDNGLRYFMIGNADMEPGVVAVTSISDNIRDALSPSNWLVERTDERNIEMTPDKFVDYARIRKGGNIITSLSQIEPNGVYIATASAGMTINSGNVASLNKSPYVFVVDGDLTWDVATFNSSLLYNVAIVVTGTLTFTETVTEANAIFMANDVVLSRESTYTPGIKIKGNLIAQNSFENNRILTDNRRPTMFVVASPKMYIELLPLFSTSRYEWRQIQ